jgi:hypothetical protein
MGVVGVGSLLTYGTLHARLRPGQGRSGSHGFGRHVAKPLQEPRELFILDHRGTGLGSFSPRHTSAFPFYRVSPELIESHVGILDRVPQRTAARAECVCFA